MNLKSNRKMVEARQERSFVKGLYKGIDVSKIPIRPGALEMLSKPSRAFGSPVPYKSVFTKERNE